MDRIVLNINEINQQQILDNIDDRLDIKLNQNKQ